MTNTKLAIVLGVEPIQIKSNFAENTNLLHIVVIICFIKYKFSGILQRKKFALISKADKTKTYETENKLNIYKLKKLKETRGKFKIGNVKLTNSKAYSS